MVGQRIPITKNGRVVSVFGHVVFEDVRDVGKLSRQLSLLESKIKLYEQELKNLSSTRYTLFTVKARSPWRCPPVSWPDVPRSGPARRPPHYP